MTPRRRRKSQVTFVLARIPSPHSPPAQKSSFVALCFNIYEIGGLINETPSSRVSILVCRSHKWCEAPNMRVERDYPSANVFDGKIYVVGGCQDCDSLNWMEVFDPKTQIWAHVWSPGSKICGCRVLKSVVIEEKVYMFGESKGLAYIPKQGRCETVGREMEHYWKFFSYCAIENVLYSYDFGVFRWYDTKERLWRDLKGLEGVSKISSNIYVDLADYGGKMAVFWDEFVLSSGYDYENREIWCAVIVLERFNSEEIWGTVEWCGAVLKVPMSYRFVCALAATYVLMNDITRQT